MCTLDQEFQAENKYSKENILYSFLDTIPPALNSFAQF